MDETRIGGGAQKYGAMLEKLRGLLEAQVQEFYLRFRKRKGNHYWLRDQVHVMKGQKYFQRELTDMLEFFLEQQRPDGMIWDHAMQLDHRASRMKQFDGRWWQYPRNEGFFYMRLPVEADVEYLLVEGVHLVWRVTGDQAWMSRWLPACERALGYCMNDPLRWNAELRLVKRAYTLDTWDFQHTDIRVNQSGRARAVFNIDKSTPMGIMHGDNSGMYAACTQLAEMYEAADLPDDAARWRGEAEGFRERTNKYCWNGEYYRHFHVVDPVPDYYPPFDQERLLTISNPYDINRGLTTPEMAASIIETYRGLREKHRDEHIAEWYGVYPAIEPDFGQIKAGTYMNGGIITIVGGELAKAALMNGYEDYGVDILNRLDNLLTVNPTLPCTYAPDGSISGGIPDDWGQAAIVSALIEGLAGVRDLEAAMGTVEIAPRWAAAGIDEADVTVSTPMSGLCVSYRYTHEKERNRISLYIRGDARRYTFKVMIPAGFRARGVVDGDEPVEWRQVRVRTTDYVEFGLERGGKHCVAVHGA